MSDQQPVHAEPEARVSGEAEVDEADLKSSVTAGSATSTEPKRAQPAAPEPLNSPRPPQPPSEESQDDEDDDCFIPRGQSVQTAAAGSKKGGRPR
ncbi:hypothetical protein OH77DRAFT_1511416 [Trametes cingulata]|nr:hypothetical protein OH77DRAFT_1511416 [Trametes cingulata]